MSGRGGGRGRGAYFKAKYGGGRSRTDHAPYDASSSAAWAGDRPAPSPSSPSSWAFAPPRGDAAALRRTLQSLEGESFGRYKQLTGSWSLALPSGGAALLSIDHVQGDAYASPSRVRVFVPPPLARLPAWALTCEARQTACADFLARSLAAAAGCRAGSYWQGLPSAQSQGSWGSEKGGQLFVDAPGQAVLRRTTVQLRSCAANQGGFGPSGGGAPSAPESTGVEARLSVALPGRGRSILGHQAAAILTQQLPEAVEAALLSSSLGLDDLRRHCESVEDSRALRDALESRGLAAFVGDGSLLPRAGGADDRPMSLSSSPELWNGPPELSVELLTPNGGMVRGTGFPRGLTVIVGGGFHGKSTLLAALQRGVYDHAPGDGRERVVALCDAVKVRAEDGRHVSSVDVSPLISTLPRGGGTRAFSSADASGSTSQAASIAEAVEAGSRLLLVDEDTSATNLMIRDARMRELVAAEREPITPFSERVRGLAARGVSTILVAGGSGDYFAAADAVLAMHEYAPRVVTAQAHAVAARHGDARREGEPYPDPPPRVVESILPQPNPSPRLRCRRRTVISVDDVDLDLAGVEQLVESSQTRAIARALLLVGQHCGGAWRGWTLARVLREVERRVREGGLDALGSWPAGDLAAFRAVDLAAAVSRLRCARLRQA